jgi:polygalacturonase
MSLRYGPKSQYVRPTSSSDVTVVHAMSGEAAVLTEPVSVDSTGLVTFVVRDSGRYFIKTKVGVDSSTDVADLTDQGYDYTDSRSYADAVFVQKNSIVINVTDYDTTQDAINSAPSGATIYFPPGTYLVPAGGFVLKSSGLTIEASGATFTVSTYARVLVLEIK